MWGENQDVFHYIMLYNQNERQPPKPEGIDDKIIKAHIDYQNRKVTIAPMLEY